MKTLAVVAVLAFGMFGCTSGKERPRDKPSGSGGYGGTVVIPGGSSGQVKPDDGCYECSPVGVLEDQDPVTVSYEVGGVRAARTVEVHRTGGNITNEVPIEIKGPLPEEVTFDVMAPRHLGGNSDLGIMPFMYEAGYEGITVFLAPLNPVTSQVIDGRTRFRVTIPWFSEMMYDDRDSSIVFGFMFTKGGQERQASKKEVLVRINLRPTAKD